MASKPTCTAVNCKACQQALIFHEKVHHQLHTLATLHIDAKEVTDASNEFPQITGVYSRVKGQIISHEASSVVVQGTLLNTTPLQSYTPPSFSADIFPTKIASKPTGHKQVRFEPYGLGQKQVKEQAKEQAKEPFKYEWLPKIQLGQGLGWREGAKKQNERQQHFKELRKSKQTAWWYCFHKMLPQCSTPCCKQCFRLAEM